MSDELPMPAKELLQSHFAIANSKFKHFLVTDVFFASIPLSS